MKRIVNQYELVISRNLIDFNNIINNRLANGWELHGEAFSHIATSTDNPFCQAVVNCVYIPDDGK